MSATAITPVGHRIPAADGRELGARRFPGTTGDVVVIASATGVPQGFYTRLAQAIAARGPTVLTFDYRGIGASLVGHPRREAVRMRDWGHLDIEGVLQYASDLAEDRVLWIGHSAGGVFLPLAASRHVPERIVTVAVLSGYWRFMAPWERVKLGIAWHGLLPLAVATFGYAPRQLWGGTDLPAGVMQDWGRWCRDPAYFFGDDTLDSSGYAEVTAPILAVRATDDPWATDVAHAAVHAAFTGTDVEYREVRPEDVGADRIGHIDLLRASVGGPAWPAIIDWLLER